MADIKLLRVNLMHEIKLSPDVSISTEYSYGPWHVHTPPKCPVTDDTLVQVQTRDMTQISAENTKPQKACEFVWHTDTIHEIAYYRVVKPMTQLIMAGSVDAEYTPMDFSPYSQIGYAKWKSPQFRIHFPIVYDKPDFTRQPRWEKL